jgi:hypothetical protein
LTPCHQHQPHAPTPTKRQYHRLPPLDLTSFARHHHTLPPPNAPTVTPTTWLGLEISPHTRSPDAATAVAIPP